jgi:predicted enzyme related to lactoylglutathione lyase
MGDFHGLPCWYELSTSDPAKAQDFYAGLLGWTWANANMPGMDYMLASIDGTMVAGMTQAETDGPPPMWSIYFSVDDVDATVAAMLADGARTIVPPNDIAGTGRFAMLFDPQGAAVGLLQPLPMDDGSDGGAFNQQKAGHGNWHELMARDAKAALAFYGKHFGWTESRMMEMGPGMTYHVFAQGGVEIGGVMDLRPGMPGPGQPFWLPYFGTGGTGAAIDRINTSGGKVLHGPQEVPGGAFIAVAQDPQGAMFAVVGPR